MLQFSDCQCHPRSVMFNRCRCSRPGPSSESPLHHQRESDRIHSIQHQTIKPQQPNTRNPNHQSAPTHAPSPNHSHTHHTSQKCPSSSARAAPSPLPPRRSQQQKPRSRWSPTCSTSESHCAYPPIPSSNCERAMISRD
jgi:hypothetical protein